MGESVNTAGVRVFVSEMSTLVRPWSSQRLSFMLALDVPGCCCRACVWPEGYSRTGSGKWFGGKGKFDKDVTDRTESELNSALVPKGREGGVKE